MVCKAAGRDEQHGLEEYRTEQGAQAEQERREMQ